MLLPRSFFFEIRTPDGEDWTESMTLWDSNGNLSFDKLDYKVGNNSVKSFTSNGTSIWINIMDMGPFDLEDNGYKELFFWVKWTHENGAFPGLSATLRLFSANESSYFELDLTDLVPTSSGEWKNATVSLGPRSQGWVSIASDWKNITGLEVELAWLTSTNLTMKIDGLYFRKYVSPIEGELSGTIITILMWAAVSFSMDWIVWAGILLMIVKVFREDVGPWNVFFVIVGYAFSVTIVSSLAGAVLLSTLPSLNLPLKVSNVSVLINKMWNNYLAYQMWLYLLPFAAEIWTAALCTIAIHLRREIRWRKAASIVTVSFIIRFMLGLFLGV